MCTGKFTYIYLVDVYRDMSITARINILNPEQTIHPLDRKCPPFCPWKRHPVSQQKRLRRGETETKTSLRRVLFFFLTVRILGMSQGVKATRFVAPKM